MKKVLMLTIATVVVIGQAASAQASKPKAETTKPAVAPAIPELPMPPDMDVVELREKLDRLEKRLAESESKLIATERKLADAVSKLETRLTQTEQMVESGNARLGELLRGGSSDATRFAPSRPVTLRLAMPDQGPAAMTIVGTASGQRLRLVGSEPVSLEVPNTGRFQYRMDGDPTGYDRVLTWDPDTVRADANKKLVVSLAVPLQ